MDFVTLEGGRGELNGTAGSAAAVVEEVAQEGPLSGDEAFSSLKAGPK